MWLFIDFVIIFSIFIQLVGDFSYFLANILSGKHLKIMNLGDGQGATGGVTAVLRDTDDDAVDPHLERIKNQAGDEESDEEVWQSLFGIITQMLTFKPCY